MTSMAIEFRVIEEGYEFVSAGPLYEHSALLDLATGNVLLQSESGDLNEFPEIIDEKRYLPIPTRSELNLGKTLVLAFVDTVIPDGRPQVLDMFSRKGAYPRFKEFLDIHALLDRWYEFESTETERALREWCARMAIPLEG